MKTQITQFFKPILRFNRRLGQTWEGRLALFLALAGIGSAVATYAALNAIPPFGNDPDIVIWLLNLDFAILLCLALLVGRRVIALFTLWRKGIPGARLHIRLVLLFGMLAMVPAMIMTLFSLYFFHYGVQAWFSDRIKTAVSESEQVAKAYLKEHHQAIKADILAMANDLDRESNLYKTDRNGFQNFLSTQSQLRNLPETFLFDAKGNILAKAPFNGEKNATLREINIPDFALQRARDFEVVILTDIEDDKVRALVRLRSLPEAFLFVGRKVDPDVLGHVVATREAVMRYEEIEQRYSEIRVTVTMIYGVVALVLLFASMWFGLNFAKRIAGPISNLISVSTRVRQGDFTARASEDNGLEEFDYLSRSFNKMTSQIIDGQNHLIDANRKLDERSRFTETVLAGVSSGIISIDESQNITLLNSAAAKILSRQTSDLMGQSIDQIFPDLLPSVQQAFDKPSKPLQTELLYIAPDGTRRMLLIRLVVELVGDKSQGLILTFDDITALQSAQKKAAWSDVARRIAHEIKNPLTPIQLSAERLQRKYQNTIPEQDRAVFNSLIETITRHVEDIGNMVTEFSNFARMPEPKMKLTNIKKIIEQVITLEQSASPNIKLSLAGEPIETRCDPAQIRQAITNLIKNAVNSIQESNNPTGSVNVDIRQNSDAQSALITISDTGQGFPKDIDLHSLTEPYVTLREKGTGLGLAIVKKIMEDHGGRVIFDTQDDFKPLSGESFDNEFGIANWTGAKIYLWLPIQKDEA
jgi:two-component system nitrogen regulation sensor histidine kinase NtrY